jgi:chemotaxis protein histidine kinase CheA
MTVPPPGLELLEEELIALRRQVAELEQEKALLKAELDSHESQHELLENLVYGLEKEQERSRQQVEMAKLAVATLTRQQDDILQHVRQGILTFGRDLRIDPSHSRAAGELFGRSELGGLTLPLLLGEHAPLSFARYLKLLFDATAASPHLLERVNPLRAHRFHDATGRERVVAFTFHSITRPNGAIDKIMAVLEDSTELDRLNRALEQRKREQWQKLERASQIMAVPANVFRDFICEARLIEQTLTGSLAAPERAHWEEDLRQLHALKGNARALGLDDLALRTHELEDAAQAVSERPSEARRAMLEDQLMAFRKMLDDGDELFRHLTGLRKSLASTQGREDPLDELLHSLESLAEREAKELDKRISVVCSRKDVASPSGQNLSRLRSALVQLVRNAVHHGIEDRHSRVSAGKRELGSIRIELRSEAGRLVVTCSDDGCGIDARALVQRAVERGFLDPSEEERLEAGDALRLIFQPGLSTRNEASQGAGRGMGMAVVADALATVHGQIEVKSEPGLGTEFRLSIPAAASDESSRSGGLDEHLGG